MSTAWRRRAFCSLVVLAFGVGFGAGIATIQAMLAPTAGDGHTHAAVLPGAGAPEATLGVNGRTVAPPRAPARGAGSTRHVGAAPRVAALTLPRERTGGLTHSATAGPEAGPAKAGFEARPPASEQIVVRRGDTLMDILVRAGITRADAHAAIAALRDIYDPRRLRAGQELLITAAHREGADAAPRDLLGLRLDLSFDHEVRVVRGADGVFAGSKVARAQQRRTVLRAGTIRDSLYVSAHSAGLPPDLLLELTRLFSWDVDFQRDIRAGDRFETLYEEVALAADTSTVRGGDLLYARLMLNGRDIEAYRFEREDGSVEYFDGSGRSVRKFLLRTPVDGARLSSRFGPRRHPILGYTRMHKGVDFAAPTGTPVYAAGSGTVEHAGRNGGYGNYVRLRHNGEYSTAYAHLHRIAKDVRSGTRVRQGEVIGYVGTTGRSTGPHLHYEVLKGGEQINPLKLEHPPVVQLAGQELARFRQATARIDRMRETYASGTLVASRTDQQRGITN